uniref:Retrotransposon protein, putative, Ty1-copia subclass n=2 Tax=Oryza sativa subsp. japonica TaxID=39947 RepID=Q53Q06_ORYSJ|nr:retrotransposon protein, putative, Ty1-copia sub-class [Oryza sativa Japonica Group]ABA92936.1 retrotransposon protein, putative, Ty1-copia subclass [Oryza sativa Japonica Group]
MTFIVKRFKHFLRKSGYGKGRKDDDKGKRQSKRACFNCGEYGHFIADCPKSNKAKAKGGKKKPERAHVAEAHMAEVWYSRDEEDPEVKPKPKSKDKVEGEGGVATVAFKSSSSSKERLFNNLSDDDDDSYHYSCFMAQGRKVMTQKPSETSLDVDSSDEESDNELDDVLKSFSKPAMQHLAKLMRALDSKEQSLERQEELLILEKKRNLALEESLAKECAKNEQLANELNLANGSLASLRDVNETLQEKFANLDKSHKDLEVQFDTLWNSTSQPNVVSNSSNPSTSNGCARWYNIDLNSYATNIDDMQALKKENERLGTLVKYGCMKAYHSLDALYKTITAHPNKDGYRLGFSGGSPVSKCVMVNGKECLMFVREGKAPQASEVTSLVSCQGPGTSGQTGRNIRVGVSVSQKFPPGSSGQFARKFRANDHAQDMTGSSGHNAWRFRKEGLYYDSYAYSSDGSSWVVDSGCTNHMTGERNDGKGKVIGLDKIAISNNQSLSNVLLVNSLSYNLLSVSQLCKLGYNCLFTDEDVTVFRRDVSSVAFKGNLKGDLYLVDFDVDRVNPETCLIAKSSMGWLWHRRLAHVGMWNLATLLKGEHILGLTSVTFEKDRVCSACQAEKQVGNPHPIKNIMTTTRPLELLHMDLFGPVAYISIGGNKYGFVIVDDFSRFTWVYFLHDKSEAQDVFKRFAKQAQNLYDLTIKRVRSDNGGEFKNTQVEEFLDEEGIKHEFSTPYDPPQNSIVERKNRTLIEAARAMLDEYKTSDIFWVEAEVPGPSPRKFGAEDSQGVPTAQVDGIDAEGTVEHPDQAQVPSVHHPRIHHTVQRDHPVDNILGDIRKGVTTRSRVANFCQHYSFVSSLEPTRVEDALGDPDWVMAMQEELNNFTCNLVWTSVERPDQNVIGTKLYQMDVKSAFLNGPILELVYVEQPPGFEDPKLPNHVYKLHKAQNGLKQALELEFSSIMTKRFEMSMMGELTFFLALQVKQAQEGTFISQTKYMKDILKKFGMEDAKTIKTPMPTNGHRDLDENGKCVDQKGCDFELLGYSDSDYAGCKVDRKSTTGTCQFLRQSLVSWSSKKQNSIALSTAEAEYVAADSCCAQLLWMKQTLKDFGYNFTKIPLLCDNESATKIANNPVQHSRTKHIDIRHHFLRDHETKGDICLTHVRTESQLADIFTKPLDEKRFCELRISTMTHEKRQKASQDVSGDESPPIRFPRGRLGKEKVVEGGSGSGTRTSPRFTRQSSNRPVQIRDVDSGQGSDAPNTRGRGRGGCRSSRAGRASHDFPVGSRENPVRLYKTLGFDTTPLHHIGRPKSNYLHQLAKCRRDRLIDPETQPEESQDPRLRTFTQLDWYNSVIMARENPVVEMKWIDWAYMRKKNNEVFNQVMQVCHNKNLGDILALEYDWNEEVIAQFYATAFFGTTRKGTPYVKWLTEGVRHKISMAQFAEMLGLDDEDLNRPNIHSEAPLPMIKTKFMYAKDAPKTCMGSTHGLHPNYKVLYSIFRWSLLPKPPFSVMKLIWYEIANTILEPKRGCIYAPFIMKMIETVTGVFYIKDGHHNPFRPHAPPSSSPVVPRSVPSTSAGSSTSAPPSSSSSSPIKKALQAIFCMCAKTAKKVKKIERRQKEDRRLAGKEVSDDSEDEVYVDPFEAYEAAHNVAGEGLSTFFNEESSHSDDDDDDDDGDEGDTEAAAEDAPTDVDEGVTAAQSDESHHSGDTEIVPSDGDE